MAAKLNVSLTEFHELMGHVSMDAAKNMIEQNAIVGIKLRDQKTSFCEACIHAKQQKKAIPDERSSPRATAYGDLVHTDVWGPARISSLRGKQYIVTFTDDYSLETQVSFVKKKSEAFEAYKHYKAWVKAQRAGNNCAATIKTLQSDRGGEYTSGDFNTYLKAQGTTRRLTTHDTPEQNGVAERKNRTLVEHARAMLYASGLSGSLLAEAVSHATWLANRTISRSLPSGKTAHELATQTKPDLSDLHTWGCTAYVLSSGGSKLDSKVREGRFMGFDEQSKPGYRVYWPNSSTVTVERNVRFNRDEILSPADVQLKGVVEAVAQNTSSEETKVEPIAPSQNTSSAEAKTPAAPKRGRNDPPANFEPYQLRSKGTIVSDSETNNDKDDQDALFAMFAGQVGLRELALSSISDEPKSHKEAMNGPECEHWKEAKDEEMRRLQQYNTYKLVIPPPGANIVGSRWVDRRKYDENGNVTGYRSRVIAQGFTQEYLVDYSETFAPTAKLTSIRMVLALAARNHWHVHQMDVKSAYLNAEIEIYVRQPEGYIEPGKETYVWKLLKSLYGLKQAGRKWHQKLTQMMKELGFSVCPVDHSIFTKIGHVTRDITIVVVSVDNMILASNALEYLDKTKAGLSTHFDIKDLGHLHWFLGFEVDYKQQDGTISFHSSKSHGHKRRSPLSRRRRKVSIDAAGARCTSKCCAITVNTRRGREHEECAIPVSIGLPDVLRCCLEAGHCVCSDAVGAINAKPRTGALGHAQACHSVCSYYKGL